MIFCKRTVASVVTLCFLLIPAVFAKGPLHLHLAVTPGVYNTGLLSVLLPSFEKKNKVKVETVVVETEKALKLAEDGEVDAVLVGDPEMEAAFLEKGFGSDYKAFMHSYFVIVGPPSDPARIKGERANYAFYKIYEKRAAFISRKGSSEIERTEERLWENAYVKQKGDWYVKTGKGMNEVLATASEKKGYALSDRLTYAAMKEMIDLDILVEGEDNHLKIVYSMIAVNPKRYPHVKYGTVMMLMDYLTSKEGREIIDDFKLNGEQLFFSGE